MTKKYAIDDWEVLESLNIIAEESRFQRSASEGERRLRAARTRSRRLQQYIDGLDEAEFEFPVRLRMPSTWKQTSPGKWQRRCSDLFSIGVVAVVDPHFGDRYFTPWIGTTQAKHVGGRYRSLEKAQKAAEKSIGDFTIDDARGVIKSTLDYIDRHGG